MGVQVPPRTLRESLSDQRKRRSEGLFGCGCGAAAMSTRARRNSPLPSPSTRSDVSSEIWPSSDGLARSSEPRAPSAAGIGRLCSLVSTPARPQSPSSTGGTGPGAVVALRPRPWRARTLPRPQGRPRRSPPSGDPCGTALAETADGLSECRPCGSLPRQRRSARGIAAARPNAGRRIRGEPQHRARHRLPCDARRHGDRDRTRMNRARSRTSFSPRRSARGPPLLCDTGGADDQAGGGAGRALTSSTPWCTSATMRRTRSVSSPAWVRP